FDIRSSENTCEFRRPPKVAPGLAVIVHAQTYLAVQSNRKLHVFEAKSIFRIVESEAEERRLARGSTTIELPVIVYATRFRKSDQSVFCVEDPVQERCLLQILVGSNLRQQDVGLIGV